MAESVKDEKWVNQFKIIIKIKNWKSRFKKILFEKFNFDDLADRSWLLFWLQSTRDKNIPESLFKYRVCNDLTFDNLENNNLWASLPSQFNDPYDSSLTFLNNEKFMTRYAMNNLLNKKMDEKNIESSKRKKLVNQIHKDLLNNKKALLDFLEERSYEGLYPKIEQEKINIFLY